MRNRPLLLLVAVMLAISAPAQTLLLQNVLIYDGSGQAPFRGDVRIAGKSIAKVGKRLRPGKGETVRDEHGLALAPGFIDMHSHADRGILENPTADNVVRQGITTVLVGQDGDSMYPLSEFLSRLEKQPAAVNLASMAGHGTLREQVMGHDLLRPSTPEELERMRRLLHVEMRSGAYGLSSGLEYDAGHFASTQEMIELAKVAAASDGFYISHVRDEGNRVFDSFREIIQIGQQARLPVEISHIKLGTTPVWHEAATRMPQIFAEARQAGVDLKADVYPYTFWESTLRVIVLDHDYFNADKVAKAIADNGGADHIRFITYQPEPAVVGKTLDQVAAAWGMTPVQAFMKVVKQTQPGADGKAPEEGVIVTSISEDDLRWFLAQAQIMFCSDGGLHDSHPRGAGSFPRILGRYVREEKVLPLEMAVQKAAALPAQQLGLSGRGKIADNYRADLVLFDPAKVLDASTVENPQAPPVGILGVMVNGVWVVEDGRVTGARPGEVLRHQPKPRLEP